MAKTQQACFVAQGPAEMLFIRQVGLQRYVPMMVAIAVKRVSRIKVPKHHVVVLVLVQDEFELDVDALFLALFVWLFATARRISILTRSARTTRRRDVSMSFMVMCFCAFGFQVFVAVCSGALCVQKRREVHFGLVFEPIRSESLGSFKVFKFEILKPGLRHFSNIAHRRNNCTLLFVHCNDF